MSILTNRLEQIEKKTDDLGPYAEEVFDAIRALIYGDDGETDDERIGDLSAARERFQLASHGKRTRFVKYVLHSSGFLLEGNIATA